MCFEKKNFIEKAQHIILLSAASGSDRMLSIEKGWEGEEILSWLL